MYYVVGDVGYPTSSVCYEVKWTIFNVYTRDCFWGPRFCFSKMRNKHQLQTKEVIHIIISFEPIRERPTLKSFHESSVKSVRIHLNGTFWQVKTRVWNNLNRPTRQRYPLQRQNYQANFFDRLIFNAMFSCLTFV